MSQRIPIYKICPICNKEFITNPSHEKLGRRFCSRPCAYIGRKKGGRTKGSKNIIQKSIKCICLSCKKEFYKCPASVKNGEGKFCSKECYSKALSLRKKDKNSPLWKHGKANINKTKRRIAMQGYKYKVWRRKVFKRDSYTCQKCSETKYVEAHHIKSWEKYPKLRYVIRNGITLCQKCHGTNRKKLCS